MESNESSFFDVGVNLDAFKIAMKLFAEFCCSFIDQAALSVHNSNFKINFPKRT